MILFECNTNPASLQPVNMCMFLAVFQPKYCTFFINEEVLTHIVWFIRGIRDKIFTRLHDNRSEG